MTETAENLSEHIKSVRDEIIRLFEHRRFGRGFREEIANLKIGTNQINLLFRANAHREGHDDLFNDSGNLGKVTFELPEILDEIAEDEHAFDSLGGKDGIAKLSYPFLVQAISLAHIIIHNYTIMFDLDGECKDEAVKVDIDKLKLVIPILEGIDRKFRESFPEVTHKVRESMIRYFDQIFTPHNVYSDFRGCGYFDNMDLPTLKMQIYSASLFTSPPQDYSRYYSPLNQAEWEKAGVQDRLQTRNHGRIAATIENGGIHP